MATPDGTSSGRLQARRLRHYALLVAGVVFIAFVIVACSTLERRIAAPPDIPGAKFVGNQTCYDCHTNYVRAFAFSPHARLHTITAQMPDNSGCESCHGPGSLHVAGGGGRGKFIVNPGRDPQACFNCHLETHAQFNLPQHHPVLEGKMNCVQCHDPHGFDIMKPARGLAMSRVNESCAECHREQARPVIFEHAAMREGCTTCHQPHGSIIRKLLTQPDQNMCLRCHAQVAGPGVARGRLVIGKTDHSALVNRGACWTSTCHTSVHGSNVDPMLRY
ncbi:MAG TPA: cytochrome c3 family protein [Candidatus Acidoferrum sp.]|nr:cytochrome c3 family protein [Candidatus Acidoferrum sp.]